MTMPAPSERNNWPLCKEKARGLAKELKLNYFDDPEHLNITETLYLLLPQAQLGDGIPPEVVSPPWKISAHHARSDHINGLLHHSMRAQMGCVPETEFKDFILSDATLATNGLLHLYLESIGVGSQIVCGVMQFSTIANADGTPYVWLEIDGQAIDNVFVYFNPEKRPKNMFFKMRHTELYVKEDPSETKRKLFFGANSETSCHTLKLYKHYGNPKNVEKYLVTCLKIVSVIPHVKMYDILMRDFIQRVHGKAVVDLEKKWGNCCWSCSAVAETLKACSICKFAKYCNPQCQKRDWKEHKILHEEVESRFNNDYK